MKNFSLFFLLACILLTACSTKNESVPKPVTLSLSAWELEELEKEPVNVSVTLKFKGKNTIAGIAGCNHYALSYTRKSYTEIYFEKGTSTLMICPPKIQEIEDKFFLALQQVQSMEQKDGKLIFYAKSGKELLLFKQAK